MHRFFLSITLIWFLYPLWSQDLNFVKKNIQTLTSPEFHGRGYVKKGDIKASEYLANQFKNFGLIPFGDNYFQTYQFEVNTFPKKMEINIDGKVLVPARDFYINPGSKGIKGSYNIVRFGLKEVDQDTIQLRAFFKGNHRNHFILLDTLGWGKDPFRKAMREAISGNLPNAAGILEVADTGMIFSVRTFANDYTKFTLRRRAIPENAKNIAVKADQKLIKHNARNVIGYLPGETDTFIVFTAHYDHLGYMGRNTMFPGANDNASGTSMVLDLIRELSEKKNHRYSYAFMLFSGEEAGLLGSTHYVQHPYFPLKNIKQVLNFDMVATGSGGVNVFNGAVLKHEYALLDTINKSNNFGIELKMKSTSRGSDHYPFHAKGVPALFILTDGKEVGYHVPEDAFEKLPFQAYEKLFKIIIQYVEAKENGQIIYRPYSGR
ncbi:MAG: DUF4910 domain-containing protein [Bacteroidales bacterium]|nr:DUF4910 domain-containing protein [Bacteroidales bacterium]